VADPAEPDDQAAAAPSEPSPPKRSAVFRWVRSLAIVTASALVGLGIFGAIWLKAYWPDLLRAEAVRRAQALGIDVEIGRMEARGILPWESGPEVIVLEDVNATVRSAPGARVRATRATVELTNHEPTHVELVDLVVAADRVEDLAALMKAGQSAPLAAVPFEAGPSKITIAKLAEAAPIPVEVRAERIAVKAGKLELGGLVAKPAIPFVEVDPLPITLERRESASEIRSKSLPGVTIELDDAATHASVTLDAVNPRALSKVLHAELPTMKVTGTIDVRLSERLAPEATFDVRLIGFVPPHPPELGGIVFGDETRATGTARLVGKKLVLPAITLKAGSLTLKGSGDVDPLGSGQLSLSLTGSIGCAELAASAVGAHFGWEGSVLTGQLARGRLTGTVGIAVELRSQIDDLEHAKATPSAVIRCGVKLP
jgi:hypothetical protein